MLASQRHNQIQVMLRENGAVTVAGLMETFGISMETARRDLAAMEKAELLTRVHGGALPLTTARFYRPLKERFQDQHSQKQAIAKAAAALVNDGDFISLGGGSTALAFAQALRNRVRTLTVVTYSLVVFEALRDMPDYTVMLSGGQLNTQEQILTGPAVANFFSGVYVQKAFIFPAVLSLKGGINFYTREITQWIAPMLHQCDQVYVLADSSKFELPVHFQTTPTRQDYIYITDKDLPEDLRQLYAKNNLKFIYAE